MVFIIKKNEFNFTNIIMLLGYNTNISYKDKIYHIQTEDSGLNNPVIITLLYFKGAIIASKKTNYSHLLNDQDYKEKVKIMMKEQHKNMIKELLSGKYTAEYPLTEKIGNEEVKEENGKKVGTNKQDIKNLDDILLNYILKRVNK